VQLFAREQTARAEAEAANHAKDQFLALLAHELRNPLAPIVTSAALLRRPGISATVVEQSAGIVERQARSLALLLDDLLDVSRITRGMVELHKTPIEIAQLVARAVETAAPHLQKRGHRLTVSMPGGPMLVNADSTRLEQVIVNVLGNAAKFTGPGGDIAIAVAGEGADAVTIRVTDNGRGIAPALLPRVFDMFTQGALTLDRTDGLTKLILDPATERILGVGLVGPGAGELIAEGVLAIEMGANATDMKLSIHPHPTLTETMMESAEVFFGQATHVYRPKRG